MTEPKNTPMTAFDWLIHKFHIITHQEIAAAHTAVTSNTTVIGLLLTPEQVAALMKYPSQFNAVETKDNFLQWISE